jgi:pimeloyl-ACP methyl ester carboxylesterase
MLLLAPPLAHNELARVADATMPCALISGARDPLTPDQEIERFVARLVPLRSHRVVADAGHDLGTAGPPGPHALSVAIDRAVATLR